MGYHKGYRYPHDFEENFVKEEYLPEEIKSSRFYNPTENGGEKAIRDRLVRLWPEKYK